MQELKEEFRKIYETSENPTEGLLSISEWLAKSSSVFTKSCQTIRNWFGEIISYFERRTTNGVVEGINNKLKLKGTWDLGYFQQSDIKRVRLIKRADGYYCQFVLSCEVKEDVKPSGKCIGIDVGLASFYTDHEGNKVDNPKFLKKSEKRLKRLQRRLSKKKKGSKNRQKARQRLAPPLIIVI